MGMARVRDGSKGSENFWTRSCILVVEDSVGAKSRGEKELDEAILITGAVKAIFFRVFGIGNSGMR